MLAAIKDWEISEEEGCSDHNILKFSLNFAGDKTQINNFLGTRHIKEQQNTEFNKNFQLIYKNYQIEDEGNAKETDEKLNERLTGQNDIRSSTKLQSTCKKTFKHLTSPNSTAKGKSFPWWTDALKIMRKRTNAPRRRHRRTLNNEELRDRRKNHYTEAKTKYQGQLQRRKLNSWKQYCTISPSNPWNEV